MEHLKKLKKSELIEILNAIYIVADNGPKQAEQSFEENKSYITNPYAYKYGYLEGTLNAVKSHIQESK